MKIITLFIFILLLNLSAFSQNLKLVHIDNSLYPEIELLVELSGNADISHLELYEQARKIDFTATPVITKSNGLFFLIDYFSFGEKERKTIFDAIAENIKHEFINIGLSGNFKRNKCFLPLNYEFEESTESFVSFVRETAANTYGEDTLQNRLECSLKQLHDFFGEKVENKTIIVISKIKDFKQAKKILSLESIFPKANLRLICSVNDLSVNKPHDLFVIEQTERKKAWEKLITRAAENEDLTNLSTVREYKVVFRIGKRQNATELEFHYFKERLKVNIEPPNQVYYFNEYGYWMIIGILLFIVLLNAKKIHSLKSQTLQLKETVSMLFDKRMKILSKQTENPVLEIKLENDFKNHHLKKLKTTIGRDKSCDVVVQDMTVSSHHATIVNEGGVFYILDNESTNGIFVNDIKIEKKQIKPGDIIRMGKAVLTLHY